MQIWWVRCVCFYFRVWVSPTNMVICCLTVHGTSARWVHLGESFLKGAWIWQAQELRNSYDLHTSCVHIYWMILVCSRKSVGPLQNVDIAVKHLTFPAVFLRFEAEKTPLIEWFDMSIPSGSASWPDGDMMDLRVSCFLGLFFWVIWLIFPLENPPWLANL